MSNNVVNMLEYLRKNSDSHAAVARVLARPMAIPADGKLTDDYVANWFIDGLWMEGFQIVKIPDEE